LQETFIFNLWAQLLIFLMHNIQLEFFPHYLASLIVFFLIKCVCRLKRIFLQHKMSLVHILTKEFSQEQCLQGDLIISIKYVTEAGKFRKSRVFFTPPTTWWDTLSPASPVITLHKLFTCIFHYVHRVLPWKSLGF
jgi:hypothetical protein